MVGRQSVASALSRRRPGVGGGASSARRLSARHRRTPDDAVCPGMSARCRWTQAKAEAGAEGTVLVLACELLVAQDPQAPPAVFRTATNIVRVDATVIDRSGNPVPSLTADD